MGGNTVPLFCSGQYAEKTYSGGFGPGVPPLPIPNREVKPGRADGTAPQCGRVGRRLLERRDAFWSNPEASLPFLYNIILPDSLFEVRSTCEALQAAKPKRKK